MERGHLLVFNLSEKEDEEESECQVTQSVSRSESVMRKDEFVTEDVIDHQNKQKQETTTLRLSQDRHKSD